MAGSEDGAAGRLAEIRRRIAAAAAERAGLLGGAGAGEGAEGVARQGRTSLPPLPRLIAVSKLQPAAAVAEAKAAGLQDFGENRVQEAEAKFAGPELRQGLTLHLIGPLQTNKAADAVRLFDWIHVLDRPSLAAALARLRDGPLAEEGRSLPRLLVQVNTGEEPQKSGVAPAGLSAFLALCREELELRIEGLMCLPPADEPAAPHFALLAELARSEGLRELSMGMSGDFEEAVVSGATMLRIGTALMGPRPAPPSRGEPAAP